MSAFLSRNLKVYFRDKASVFFSMLSALMIIMIYMLFLGNVWTEGLPDLPEARVMMNNWILSGLLAVTSLTTTMGAFGTMVDDKSRKLFKDFQASPISGARLTGGYVLSSFLIGVIMTLFTFLIAEIYIVASGGAMLSLSAVCKVLGLILLCALCNTAMVLFLVSFLKTNAAFATASTIIGTLIGFVAGIYMPIGMLPQGLQYFIKAFPLSHAAALFRQVMMQAPMEQVFKGAPAQALADFKEEMGVTFQWNGQTMTPLVSVLIICAAIALFYGLCVLRLSKKNR